MRSKARLFDGEPIHPILVHFPLAFLIGAVLFDLAGVAMDRPLWWEIGAYLLVLGVATALLAAVPGFIDYFYTVPPQSSYRKRATWHLVLNLVVVAIFALARLVRGDPGVQPDVPVLGLEVIGLVILLISGWLGSSLIYHAQVGVDHSYAADGRWREESLDAQGESYVIASAAELEPNQMKLLRVNGMRIVLARTETGYVAFQDSCTHEGGSLAGGVLACGVVQCPWHGSQFDARTGVVRSGPAAESLRLFRVEELDGKVRVFL